MVNNPTNAPKYPIEDIRKAADEDRVVYFGKGRAVQRDLANLGYCREDLIECLKSLSAGDFLKTVKYEEKVGEVDLLCDCYETQCSSVDRDEADAIYLKLFVRNSQVFICSFHLPR